jgi:hypothetical protein
MFKKIIEALFRERSIFRNKDNLILRIEQRAERAIQVILNVAYVIALIILCIAGVIWGFYKVKDWYYNREQAPFWKDTERLQVCKTPYYSSNDCYFLTVTLRGKDAAVIHFKNGGYIITYNLTCYYAAEMYGKARYKFCRSWDEDGHQWDFMPANIVYSTVVICHAGTPVLPLAHAASSVKDKGVCDGLADCCPGSHSY